MTTSPTHRRPPRVSMTQWWLGVAPLAFLAVALVWPTASLIVRGFADAAGSTIPWARIADAALTTAWLAAAGTVATLLVGLPATWALFRRSWRGHRLGIALATIPFVLPTVVVATAFRALTRDAEWAQGEAGIAVTIVAALVFFNVAVVLRIVGPVWAALDDRTYWAARTLGASPWQALVYVRVPSLLPALAAAAATVWLFCSASFGVVIIVGGGSVATVDTEIWLQANTFLNLSAASVLAIVQVAMIAVTFLVASRLRASTGVTPAARTARPARLLHSRTDRVAVTLALAPAALLFTVPLTALVMRSLATRDGVGVGNYVRLLAGEPIRGTGTSAWSAMTISTVTALATALIATALAVGAALVIARRPGARWVHGAMLLPLGVSSVVVGLGALITLSRPLPGGFSLVDAHLLVPMAHIVIALPLAVSVLVPAFRAIDHRLLASASTLGASPIRVFTSVEWPLTRRAVAMAAGLSAAVSLGEFGATSFLARPGFETLPTLIFRLLGRPGPENVGMAFAAAVILAAITAALVLIADTRRSPVRLTP